MGLKLSVEAYKLLSPVDIKILQAIEKHMSSYEYVPLDAICRYIKYDEEFTFRALRKLDDLGLVMRQKGPYMGFILTSRGYDCLALDFLVRNHVIKAVDVAPLGIGKEADVHKAISTSGENVILKFHRLGRTSFRQLRKLRDYAGDRRHISWLYYSRLAAEKEYEALRLLYSNSVKVPRPIFHNRHAVVMGFFDGIPLFHVPPLENPMEIFANIVDNVRRSFLEAGVIHGDLSEYNVLVDPSSNEILIIDWPQWISSIHPLASFYLRRDLENICKFFRRKYRVGVDVEKIFKYVTGERESII